MSFEQDAELISSYNEWVIQRRAMANDITPEAFLEDRMKQDAAERVVKAIEYIETFGPYTPDDVYRDLDTDKTRHMHVRRIEGILRGTV